MDFDGLRNKLEDLVEDHPDQLRQGIAKAEQFAKKKLDGHDKEIDGAAAKLREFVDDAAAKDARTKKPAAKKQAAKKQAPKKQAPKKQAPKKQAPKKQAPKKQKPPPHHPA